MSNGCSKESGRLGFTLTSFSQAKWPKMASEAIYPPSCCMLMATGLWPHHLQKEPSYLFGPSRFAVRQKIFGEKQTEMQSLWSISSHIEALQPDSAKTPTLHSCQILFTIESLHPHFLRDFTSRSRMQSSQLYGMYTVTLNELMSLILHKDCPKG